MNKINQNWIFGQGAHLNFANNTPLPGTSSIITNEGCASVSDANGDLLFYTDGVNVWDAVGTVKYSSLLGHSSSTQSSIIVPDPGNKKRFYILTTDGSSHSFADAQPTPGNPPNHFNGVRLDINTWGVEQLSNIPDYVPPTTANFSPTEKITAIQSKDCTAFWVITIIQKGIDTTTNDPGISNAAGIFRVFLIDSNGIKHFADSQIIINNVPVDVHDAGYLKASPDGARLAFANWILSNVLIFPFDNSTGSITTSSMTEIKPPDPLPLNIDDTDHNNTGHARGTYGVEFSPDSNLLYYSILGNPSTATGDAGRGYVYQVDLGSNSQILVGTHENADASGLYYAIGALQLGMNGIIYIAQSGEQYLGAILSPNTVGTGCDLQWDQVKLEDGTQCRLGLPNLLPNPCEESCNCGCTGCNDDAEEQNKELIERAKTKYNVAKSRNNCSDPFAENCEKTAVKPKANLEPCFYFHWGDGSNDQIEEHDTEVFYITVCNSFSDIQFNGLRITKINLVPNTHPIDKIQIVPDRFISLDCLEPCSCQTREFAMITRANDTAGTYIMEVEYCYENITITSSGNEGKVEFELEITED